MQYMKDMMEGLVNVTSYSNNHYPGIKWTTITEFLVLEMEKDVFE